MSQPQQGDKECQLQPCISSEEKENHISKTKSHNRRFRLSYTFFQQLIRGYNRRVEHLSWSQKLEAILVGISGFFANIIIIGFIACLAIYFVEFKMAFPQNQKLVSLAIFLPTGVFGSVGIISGIFLSKFGIRTTALIGGTLLSIGVGASAYVTSVSYLLLFLGMLSGTGCSFVYLSINMGLASYFNNVGRLLISLVTIGEGFGCIIIPVLVSYLIERFYWRGSLLLLCGFMMQCIPCGLMYSTKVSSKKSCQKKLDKKPEEESNMKLNKIISTGCISGTNFDSASARDKDWNSKLLSRCLAASGKQTEDPTQKQEQNYEINERQNLTNSVSGNVVDINNDPSINCDNDMSTASQTFPHQQSQVQYLQEINLLQNDSKDKFTEKSEPQCYEKLDSKLSQKAILLSILSNKNYVLFLFTVFVMFGCINTVLTILPDYCVKQGITLSQSANIYAIGATGDIPARILGTWLVYKNNIPSVVIFSISAILSGCFAAIYPFLSSPTYISMLTFCTMMTVGLTYSVYSVVVLDFFDIKRYALASGLSETLSGLGIVLFGYITGLFTEYNRSYTYSFYLLALLSVTATLPTLIYFFIKQKKTKRVISSDPYVRVDY